MCLEFGWSCSSSCSPEMRLGRLPSERMRMFAESSVRIRETSSTPSSAEMRRSTRAGGPDESRREFGLRVPERRNDRAPGPMTRNAASKKRSRAA
jgi:hypothetical protein